MDPSFLTPFGIDMVQGETLIRARGTVFDECLTRGAGKKANLKQHASKLLCGLWLAAALQCDFGERCSGTACANPERCRPRRLGGLCYTFDVPAAAWAQLDAVDLQTEFAPRLPTTQGVPGVPDALPLGDVLALAIASAPSRLPLR